MALVRVYCGVATAEVAPWLTVAVVDDSGRLLDVRHVGDDATGYAALVTLLANRTSGPCPVALDHHQHVVAQILAAADRPIAIADEASVRDFADRFADENSYEEMQAPASQRQAVGLARALQAGVLSATAQSPVWDLTEMKPVLAAHAALVAGRQAAAVALREVLRELYPAALRAYLDPAEVIPLRVLEAFPEPGMLASPQAVQAVINDLTASGITDATTATNAVNALRVAAEESRGRGNPYLAPAVAETVRQAVVAVRSWDAAGNALVASLAERLSAPATPAAGLAQAPTAPVSPAVTQMPVPDWSGGGAAMGTAAPAAHAPIPDAAQARTDTAAPPTYGIPTPRPEPGRSDWSDPGAPGQATPGPMPSGPGAPAHAATPYDQPSTGPFPGDRPPYAPSPNGHASEYAPSANGHAGGYGPSANGHGPGYGPSANGHGPGYGSSPNGHDNGHGASSQPGGWEQRFGPPPQPTAPTSPPQAQQTYDPETLSFSADPLTAPLDTSASSGKGDREGRSGDSTDDDLLIFSQTNSAWFTASDGDRKPNWDHLLSDEGWRAAEQVAEPTVGPETPAGLPRRVPMANLVPGSVTIPSGRQPRIVRDPRKIAAHTEGYFRGWRRGQEVGGFAVGHRDRAAWEFNREQRARQGAARLS